MTFDNNQELFVGLLKAGLWADQRRGLGSSTSEVSKSSAQFHVSSDVDWGKVFHLAQEQSVQGVVLRGIEELQAKNLELNVPKVLLLQWIGEVQIIEQRNKEMNVFVADLIEKLRKNDIYAILVKGQGIAQCYEKPLWRASGDVDLLLSRENYEKAIRYLTPLASRVDEENKQFLHLAMIVDSRVVELHGSMRNGLWKRLDRVIDDVMCSVFYEGYIRSWVNDKTQVFIPRADEDIILVFSHILQHFFQEGIGMRQICDWCRLLYSYRDSLNYRLLESRIRKAGIVTEWKAFAAFSVRKLGMPENVMPFYNPSAKWEHKAKKIQQFVFETGSFGHNRDYSYYEKYPYWVFKSISFWRHTKDAARYFGMFPLDAIKVWWNKVGTGISIITKGK